MPDHADKWGALRPLAGEVTKKTIDGFEIPFELVSLVDTEWPDGGGAVVRYKTPQGVLLFRENAHEAYGHISAKNFAAAAKRNSLRAKTVFGAISIGKTRVLSNRPIYISLSIKNLWTDMRFYAENGDEAIQIRDFLKKLYPEARVNISENNVKLALTNAFSFNVLKGIKNFHTLLPRQKKAVFILLGIGIATLSLAVITPLKIVPSGLDILSFILLMLALFSLVPRLMPDSSTKEETTSPSPKEENA